MPYAPVEDPSTVYTVINILTAGGPTVLYTIISEHIWYHLHNKFIINLKPVPHKLFVNSCSSATCKVATLFKRKNRFPFFSWVFFSLSHLAGCDHWVFTCAGDHLPRELLLTVSQHTHTHTYAHTGAHTS